MAVTVQDFPSTQEEAVASARATIIKMCNDYFRTTAALRAELLTHWEFAYDAPVAARNALNFPSTTYELVAQTRTGLSEVVRKIGNAESADVAAQITNMLNEGAKAIGYVAPAGFSITADATVEPEPAPKRKRKAKK